MTHKTKKITLQWAKVDTKMIPLIRIMNADPEIHTTHCCEGNPKANASEGDTAYVRFIILSSEALHRVLTAFCPGAEIKISRYEGIPIYTMRFPPTEIKYLIESAERYLLSE
jgi:hypothetical protein